ncbi:multiple inositol polyphosphate phosphatase 1-like [Chironomus tepperi]|uniref:multiple inositol polyphosphate phosphatase 1-like n=1 Tax=Chironomus tepperi TaxID=113505 RepID=UPI00391EF828
MKRYYCIVLFVLLKILYVTSQREYCYSNDNDKKQTRQYATKTAYEVARGHERRYFNVPKCEAVKFWLLSRHGTRNPSGGSIEEMRKLVDVRDGIVENLKRHDRDRHLNQLCNEDLENLKNWRLDTNLTSMYGNFLTVQGWNDMKYMAIDYQRTFQNVIETRYSKEKFRFGYTDTQRGEASYKAFVEGLFGPEAYKLIDTKPELNSSLFLRPYDSCGKWEEQEDKVKNQNSEYFKFQQSDVFKKMLEEVSIRLGYKYTLTPKNIDKIWDMCRYDQAWYLQEDSPWCAAFLPEHVTVLEYLEDLKYYYKAGFGNELNSNVMCTAVQDMVRFLQTEHLPKVAAYFAHASSIQLLLTALGYAKDNEPLRADNYHQMKNRKFKTSILSPLASNLAVVKYDCPDDQNRYKVQFFLNERPIDFDWCNIGLCDLSTVLQKFSHFSNSDCANLYCGGNTASYLKLSVALISLATLFNVLF